MRHFRAKSGTLNTESSRAGLPSPWALVEIRRLRNSRCFKENGRWRKFSFFNYSAYGHIETMAYAVAEGARSAGADVTVKRIPELVPEEVAKASLDLDA
jgi:hypothetical protein